MHVINPKSCFAKLKQRPNTDPFPGSPPNIAELKLYRLDLQKRKAGKNCKSVGSAGFVSRGKIVALITCEFGDMLGSSAFFVGIGFDFLKEEYVRRGELGVFRNRPRNLYGPLRALSIKSGKADALRWG